MTKDTNISERFWKHPVTGSDKGFISHECRVIPIVKQFVLCTVNIFLELNHNF